MRTNEALIPCLPDSFEAEIITNERRQSVHIATFENKATRPYTKNIPPAVVAGF